MKFEEMGCRRFVEMACQARLHSMLQSVHCQSRELGAYDRTVSMQEANKSGSLRVSCVGSVLIP
jgi:hypothetical protein